MPPRNPHEEDRDIPSPDAVAAPRPPGSVARVRPEHLYKTVGLLFLFALLLEYLHAVVQVLLIAYAAAIVAVAFNAIVRLVPRHRRWGTALLGLVIVALLLALIWFGGSALLVQMREFARQAPHFQQELIGWENWMRAKTGLNIDFLGPQARDLVSRLFMGGDQDVLGRAQGLLELIFLPLLILFGALFAVGNPNDRLLTPLLRAVPRERRTAVHRALGLLGMRLLGWIKGTMLAMTIIGALSTVVFYLLGVRYALLLGVWAGLLEFIPLLGPWVGGLTAVVVAFLQDPRLALWTALSMLAIQQLESNLITPLVMAKVADVHPFVTLFALLLFGTTFGFLGLLLALPLVLLFWTAMQVFWVERAIDTDRDRIAPVVEE